MSNKRHDHRKKRNRNWDCYLNLPFANEPEFDRDKGRYAFGRRIIFSPAKQDRYVFHFEPYFDIWLVFYHPQCYKQRLIHRKILKERHWFLSHWSHNWIHTTAKKIGMCWMKIQTHHSTFCRKDILWKTGIFQRINQKHSLGLFEKIIYQNKSTIPHPSLHLPLCLTRSKSYSK